jgi:hypothetical protein
MCPQIALLEYELLCPHSLTYYELVEARQCGTKRARLFVPCKENVNGFEYLTVIDRGTSRNLTSTNR